MTINNIKHFFTLVDTTKKHWMNGYQVRGGGNFKTLAGSVLNFGIMFCWGKNTGSKIVNLYFYKLK